MIEHDKELNFYEVFCDHAGCSYTIYGNGDFLSAVDRLKQGGWNIKKAAPGTWLHYCPVHTTFKPKDETVEVPF